MTTSTASLLAPCKTCDLSICPGAEGCPAIVEEVQTNQVKPAIHAEKYALKIPNDIVPILKKGSITPPKDGKIFLTWDAFSKRIKIIIWDSNKKKKDRETILYTTGSKDFHGRVLHFRGNVLIKIQN